MAVLSKPQALVVIRHAFGPDVAESMADQLPDQIDPDDPADAALLAKLGLTRERLLDALGGDL